MNLDLPTALHMAKVAYTMYGRRAASLTDKNQGIARLTEVAEFATRRVRCCVGYWRSGERASVVVAFRGSSNSAEWVNNAHLARWEAVSPIIAGRVHPGFTRSLAEVWKEAAEAIEALCQAHLPELLSGYAGGKSVPLCLTGHSRGGAFAILAGLHALTTFRLPVCVYTFGAPRVGDGDFARAYEDVFRAGASMHWRFEGQGDPVPMYPWALQAQHTGSLAYLTPGSRTVEILGGERRVARRVVHSVSMKPSQRHRMATYLNHLRQVSDIDASPTLATLPR